MEIWLSSLMTVLQPTNILLLFSCAIAGVIFGAIPGLSGTLGLTLLLPLTFGVTQYHSFSMMLGMYVGGVSGAFIAAVLVGIPGSPSAIATCFDGYPMSRKGQTSKALSLGIIGSFIGTFFSCIIAIFVSGPISDLALKLGPWDLFSLCLCAVVLVSSLSKGNTVKGLVSAGLGFLAVSVGLDPITASKRFTFNLPSAQSGISMMAVMMGVYALFQVVGDYAHGSQKMPDVDSNQIRGIGVSVKELVENAKTIVIAFFMGLWIGFLPGMGASLANMIAYAQCKSASKHPEEFGTGCTAGILASEVSNNASVGGALIPMLSLGIPGDSATALLLSAMIINGLQPGPLFISSYTNFAYFIFLCVLLAALFVIVLQLFTKRWFPKLLKAPYHYLYSIILIMCFVGVYSSSSTIFNLIMLVVFMMVGVVFSMADIPASPMILAYILGSNLESYFRKGVSYSDNGYMPFLTRPVSLLFLVIAAGSIIVPIVMKKKSSTKAAEK